MKGEHPSNRRQSWGGKNGRENVREKAKKVCQGREAGKRTSLGESLAAAVKRKGGAENGNPVQKRRREPSDLFTSCDSGERGKCARKNRGRGETEGRSTSLH